MAEERWIVRLTGGFVTAANGGRNHQVVWLQPNGNQRPLKKGDELALASRVEELEEAIVRADLAQPGEVVEEWQAVVDLADPDGSRRAALACREDSDG